MSTLNQIPVEKRIELVIRSVYEGDEVGPGGTTVIPGSVSNIQIDTPPGGWTATAQIESSEGRDTLLAVFDGEQYSDTVQGADAVGAEDGDRTDVDATPEKLVLLAARSIYENFEGWSVDAVRSLRPGEPAGGLTVEIVISSGDGETLLLEGVWDGEEWSDRLLDETKTDELRIDAPKKGGGKRAAPKCVKGRPCGRSCIARAKNCRIKPEGVVKQALTQAASSGGAGGGAGGSGAGAVTAETAKGSDFFADDIAKLKAAGNDMSARLPVVENLYVKLYQYVDAKRAMSSPVSIKAHGMKSAQKMTAVEFDGMKIHDSRQNQANTIRQLLDMPGAGTPEMQRLTSLTSNVYLAKGGNASDAYWAKMYNRRGFKSAATGGDGNIVVYNNEAMASSTFVHEAGHNLAKAIYGNATPPFNSDFGSISTRSPTDYGNASRAEDFADSVMLYFGNNGREGTLDNERRAVIDRILRDPNYGG
jgi:hypothetical protein